MAQGPVQALNRSQAALAARAFSSLERGDPAAALGIARQLVAAMPAAPDAQHLLALCLARSGQAAAAEAAFRQALALAPGQPRILCNLANLLRQSGRHEEALDTLAAAVAAAPGVATSWVELGLSALRLGRHEQAISALQRALELAPDTIVAWHGLGSAYQACGQPEHAAAALQRAATLAPADGRIWASLGGTLRGLGRADEAIDCFDRAEQAGLRSPQLTDARVGALIDQGLLDAALRQARALRVEHPDYIPGHRTLAHLLWEHGAALAPGEDPLAAFRARAAHQPDNLDLQLAWAGFLLSARRHEEALQCVQTLRHRIDHPFAQALHAEALDRLGQREQAAPLFEAAYRAIGARDPSFLNSYIRHLLASGRWDAAARCAGEALQIDPHDQQALAYLGTAWRLLDDPREFEICDYQRLIGSVEPEPPTGYDCIEAFLHALLDELETLHRATHEPMHQSLRKGSQTAGRLFGRQRPLIRAAEQVLTDAVERWLAALPAGPAHPFLRRNTQRIRMAGSWSVKLRTSGNHVNHVHPEGWVSSAFYVALPPSVAAGDDGSQAGCIQFGQPSQELGLDLPPRRVIRPQAGRLVLFPSYLWHGTVPFHDAEPRVTIAFDLLPKPINE